MRCLIIDDEPAAREILEKYIKDTPELELIKSCKDALEGRLALKEQKPDLLFLDIKMPRLTGIELLKSLQEPPKVILTTAYSEYALEGFELDVIDYLLKPFSFERFLKAVDKALDKAEGLNESNHITVKADGKWYRLSLQEILYAESQGDYVTVHTPDKKIMFNQTLSGFNEQLPDMSFCRVHRSYVVALSKIDYLEGNSIRIGDQTLPVGKSYKEAFMKKYTA